VAENSTSSAKNLSRGTGKNGAAANPDQSLKLIYGGVKQTTIIGKEGGGCLQAAKKGRPCQGESKWGVNRSYLLKKKTVPGGGGGVEGTKKNCKTQGGKKTQISTLGSKGQKTKRMRRCKKKKAIQTGGGAWAAKKNAVDTEENGA